MAVFVFLSGLGAEDEGKHLSIDAHETAGGTAGYYTWATSWGSYDKTTIGSKTVEVFVRNFGLKSAIANVTVYFICAGVECGRATKDFDLTNQREMKAAVTAPAAVSREVNLPSINYRSKEPNR
jgi:hypothetical protein